MDEKDKDKKPNLPPVPPFPPGINLGPAKKPEPPVPPPGGMQKPALPGIPGQGAPIVPQMQPFGVPGVFHPAKDSALEEARRAKEEKESLEKKVLEMEKSLAQEKEKVLLATLKSQQDEVLSSKVENSLREIQDKLRRDRHEQEIEEERIRMQVKIKELETKLVQERETWMQTLKGQMQQMEVQDRDVETHFLHRLQEMERRWLDEKAQWQKIMVSKEDEIRHLKNSDEKLAEVEDEFRKMTLEKSMLERELSRMKDELARTDREKASIESYIREIPEKEKEIANLKAEVSILKMREEKVVGDYKNREDKYLMEIDKLQKDVGTISDRKHQEKEEEMKKLQLNYNGMIQEKEKTIAEISGEKIRAISELVRMKGFMSKIQAINAALEKERSQMRLEKMQIAQNMANNLEESKKTKNEMETFRTTYQTEIDNIKKKYKEDIERAKTTYGGDIVKDYEAKILDLTRRQNEEMIYLRKKHEDEMVKTKEEFLRERESIVMQKSMEYENKVQELRQGYEQKIIQIRDEVHKNIAKEYEERIEALKSEIETHKAMYDERVTELKNETETDKTELEKIKKEKESTDSVAISLKGKLERYSQEIAHYKNLLAQYRDENSKAKNSIEEFHQKVYEYDRAVFDLKNRLEHAVSEYDKLTARFNEITKATEIKGQKLSDAEKLFADEKDLRLKLEQAVLSLKDEVNNLSRQSAEYKMEKEDIASAFERTVNNLKKEFEKSKAEKELVETKFNRFRKSSFADRLKWALKGESKKEESEE